MEVLWLGLALLAGQAQASPLLPAIVQMHHHQVVAHKNNRSRVEQDELDRRLLPIPELEQAQLPDPSTPFERLIYPALQADLFPTEERIQQMPHPLDALFEALTQARILRPEATETTWALASKQTAYLPENLAIAGSAWSKRFVLYGTLAVLETSLQPIAQHYFLKSIVRLSGQLKPPSAEEHLALLSSLFQSSAAKSLNPEGFQELLLALTPEAYRELDYKRFNEALKAVESPWFWGRYSHLLEEAACAVRSTQDQEYEIFSQARSVLFRCDSLFPKAD